MIRHSGPLHNWRTRQNVFNCINDYIGTHGKAVIFAGYRYNVGVRTIYTWIANGSIVHHKNSTRDGTNNRKITHFHLEYLKDYLMNIDCQLYYEEQSELLWKEFAERYSASLIRNSLKLDNWTRKIITGIAAEQNNILRNIWRQWICKG